MYKGEVRLAKKSKKIENSEKIKYLTVEDIRKFPLIKEVSTDFILCATIEPDPSLGCEYRYIGELHEGQNIYAICLDGRVVKIGLTAAGMKKRFASYSAGIEKNRKESGTCSTTNYHISFFIRKFVESGKIEIYHLDYNEEIFVDFKYNGEMNKAKAIFIKGIEKHILNDFKKRFGFLPILSNNT